MSEFANGWIEIRRTSQYTNKLRKIDIWIDGAVVGSVKDGESRSFELTPGEHQLFAQIDWCKSSPLGVNITAGGTESFTCGSDLAGWRVALALFSLFKPSEFVYLRRIV